MKRTLLRFLIALFALCLVSGCGSSRSEDLFLEVSLSGGSGKASVQSPAKVERTESGLVAEIRWSSSSYDYMVVNGETYVPVSTEGISVFEIPIPSEQCVLEIEADTTAMSVPHLISYTLTFGEAPAETDALLPEGEEILPEELPGLTRTGSMELAYAQQFSVDYYGDLALITIAGEKQVLLVPEGGEVPEGLSEKIIVLQQPLERIYLVSSSAMDLFAECGAMDALGFCALSQDAWHVEAAAEAMAEGRLVYAGKYSAPDYERLRAGGCSLAIENQMISHSPEVVEKLEALGIPVLTERSSYEVTPQGRMEWIRLYGLLTGHLPEAEAALEKQLALFSGLETAAPTGESVAFFYFTQSGTVSVRNGSDYIAKLIGLAGGEYLFSSLGANSAGGSSVIGMEEFYAAAKDADILIYNSTIAGELHSLDELLRLCPLLAHCRAVQEGRVYCVTEDLYQSAMKLGSFASEVRSVLEGEDGTEFLYRLE